MHRSQEFTCPQCGHSSQYDPWSGPARCLHCGYSPVDGPPAPVASTLRAFGTYLEFLDELQRQWQGTHTPNPHVPTPTDSVAERFFAAYQETLGDTGNHHSGSGSGYLRQYVPERRHIAAFARSYARLRRGERAQAASGLRRLTQSAPLFADAWLWLSAATDDESERRDALERAFLADPVNPLVRDAWAIYTGRVNPAAPTEKAIPTHSLAECPRCGGHLSLEIAHQAVRCDFCGYQLSMLSDAGDRTEPRILGDLILRRRLATPTVTEEITAVRCQSCAAELIVAEALATICPYCQSNNVVTATRSPTIMHPDGLVPFAVERTAAAELARRARGGRWFRLRGRVGTRRQPSHLGAVYLPFWCFSGFVQARSYGILDAGGPPGQLIDEQLLSLGEILLLAARHPPRLLADKLQPYHLESAMPFELPLLASTSAALHTLDVEETANEARDSLIRMATEQTEERERRQRRNSRNSDEVEWPVVQRRSFRVSGMTYRLLLLPVWTESSASTGELIALINGQTGSVSIRR